MPLHKNKIPDRATLPRTNNVIRGATLLHGMNRALYRIPAYPRQLTYAPTLQNTLRPAPHLTAPSAVHLTACFLPGSQHPGLSGKALLPLSPHQRFGYVLWGYFTTAPQGCQEKICPHNPVPRPILSPTRHTAYPPVRDDAHIIPGIGLWAARSFVVFANLPIHTPPPGVCSFCLGKLEQEA